MAVTAASAPPPLRRRRQRQRDELLMELEDERDDLVLGLAENQGRLREHAATLNRLRRVVPATPGTLEMMATTTGFICRARRWVRWHEGAIERTTVLIRERRAHLRQLKHIRRLIRTARVRKAMLATEVQALGHAVAAAAASLATTADAAPALAPCPAPSAEATPAVDDDDDDNDDNHNDKASTSV